MQLFLQAIERWWEMELSRKIAGCASAAVACCLAFAAWVAASYVKDAMIHRSAAATALYMDSFIAPHVQKLATRSTLSDAERDTLERLLAPTAVGRPIVGFRIWVEDRIIFSNEHEMIGRTFGPTAVRSGALAGGVSAQLDGLDGEDDVEIAALGVPILQVYAPVRQIGSGRIMALVETYEIATNLRLEVWAIQAMIWLVTVLAAAGTTVLFFGLAGSRAREVSRLHYETEQYRKRVGRANRRVSEINELHMRQVGTELVEGPAQMMGLALLKLDSLCELIAKIDMADGHPTADVETIKSALQRSLGEIRSLSASLVPSATHALSLTDTIVMATGRHELSGAPVVCRFGALPTEAPYPIKACLYRFVQDGLEQLSNGRETCEVHARGDDATIHIAIQCAGATAEPLEAANRRQPFFDLRDRVEALGGAFSFSTDFDVNCISARFKITDMEAPL